MFLHVMHPGTLDSRTLQVTSRFRKLNLLLSLAFGLAGASLFLHAGTNLTTTMVQPANTDWTFTIWKTNGSTTTNLVSPIASNTYRTISNSTSIGNNTVNTRVRPPITGTATFPGDSLTLQTNTEFRLKAGSLGNSMNFPGVGGNPGLILNGGMLNGGDDATFPITGPIQVSAQSYISHGAAGGGGGISQNRAINFNGVLTGSNNIVILNAGTTIPQQVS